MPTSTGSLAPTNRTADGIVMTDFAVCKLRHSRPQRRGEAAGRRSHRRGTGSGVRFEIVDGSGSQAARSW
jgi:hypothetical protein